MVLLPGGQVGGIMGRLVTGDEIGPDGLIGSADVGMQVHAMRAAAEDLKEDLVEGAEGAEISFPSAPDVKYTVLKVTDQKVDLEYTEQGKTEKTQFSLELK
jgi:hypothetical protein